MKRIKKFRLITALLWIFLAMCLTGLFILQQSNQSLNTRLDKERLKSEALLSEKLLIQKGFEGSKKSNKNLEIKNMSLSKLLFTRTEILSRQVLENKRIKKALHFTKQLHKNESANFKALKEKLASNNIIYSKQDSLNKIMSDNWESIQEEKIYLQNELKESMLRSIDQVSITGLKNNNRATSKARAVKKLVANVEVSGKLKDLKVIVEGPNGSVLSEHIGVATVYAIDPYKNLATSTKENRYSDLLPQKIQITYTPKEKLKPGICTFKILNEDQYIGSMQVKLR